MILGSPVRPEASTPRFRNAPLLIAVAMGVVACSAAPAKPTKSAPRSVQGVAPRVEPAASSSPEANGEHSAAATASAPAQAALTVESVQVLSVPVTAIALGDGTRVAALAEPPYAGDARGLRPLALPFALRPKAGEVDQAGIYFGRDNEPRIMGTRQTKQGEVAIYWRHLPNGWRDGREEIGQLASGVQGGLWGTLGGADPELVCRTGAVCIIKRQSGWTTAPAGGSQRIVTLQDGTLWGLDESGIARIDKRGWAIAVAA